MAGGERSTSIVPRPGSLSLLFFMNALLVTAFYKFVHLPDYREMRDPVLSCCRENGIRGSILLAAEGINGTIAGPPEGIRATLDFLRNDPRLADLEHKESHVPADRETFYRMKVRLKKEIVTMGVPTVDPRASVGTYVDPQDWNRLIADPDVLLIDTRNDYEVGIGTFAGAQDPGLRSFREFPEFVRNNLDPAVHKRVAMFCTGGIRCEKASSYLLAQGFEEVYHLKGGILKYLEEVPEEKSAWEGECYVFDNRVAVDHHLAPGSYELCYACRRPVSEQEKTSPHYRYGISCSRCIDEFTDADRKRFAERMRQIELAERKRQRHIGEP